MFRFVTLKKYLDLSIFCMREKKRRQDAEYQVSKLTADNDTLGQLVMHYKRKADRLEYAVHHPRQRNGQYSRIIPITKVEFTA